MKSIRGIELRQSGEEVEVETYDLTGKVHTLITDFFHVVTKDEEESCDEMGTDTPPPPRINAIRLWFDESSFHMLVKELDEIKE